MLAVLVALVSSSAPASTAANRHTAKPTVVLVQAGQQQSDQPLVGEGTVAVVSSCSCSIPHYGRGGRVLTFLLALGAGEAALRA